MDDPAHLLVIGYVIGLGFGIIIGALAYRMGYASEQWRRLKSRKHYRPINYDFQVVSHNAVIASLQSIENAARQQLETIGRRATRTFQQCQPSNLPSIPSDMVN